MMVAQLSTHWWAVALRGVVAMFIGLIAILAPLATIAALVMLFGAYVLVDGILTLVAAARRPSGTERWWVMLIEGLIGVLLGIFLLVIPLSAAVAFVWLLAAWAIVTGILEIVAAVELRREMEGEWILAAAGLISLVLGILMFILPRAGIVAFSWMTGIYAVLFGTLQIGLAFRLRSHSGGYSADRMHAPPV